MHTQHIVDINHNLTWTPFKWMLQLEDELDILSPFLHELISRCSGHNNCFRIRQHLMPFKVMDVYFARGCKWWVKNYI